MAMLYFYGNNEQYVDLIYIVALCVSCLFCWADKDTLSALLILLAYWGLTKLLYAAPDTLTYWAVIYGVCIALSFYYIHHLTAKLVLIVTLYSIGAEWFWWHSNYANKPEMHYWAGLLALILWTRQLLFNRVIIADNYFGYVSGKIALDEHVRHILYLYFGLVTLMILEYFARHLGAQSNMTMVYEQFTLVANTLSAITLAVIYMHYFHNQSQKYFTA